MRFPNGAWGVIVVALGILAGCSKKPTVTTSSDETPTPAPKVNLAPPTAPSPDRSSKPKGKPDQYDLPPGTVMVIPPGNVEVSLCKFDGVEKAIANARGKVVLLDCWATWCPPCVASFPKLVEKYHKYGNHGLAVISVSVDDPGSGAAVIAFLKKQNATFTNLHVPLDASSQKGFQEKLAFGNSIPHAALFDRTGNRVWVGHPVTPNLVTMIEKELAKGTTAP